MAEIPGSDGEPGRNAGLDIVEVLRSGHAELRMLLAGIARMSAGEDQDHWLHLADSLVRHEVAEELVVYPALLELSAGTAVSQSRTRDQAAIRHQLVSLDRAGFGTAAFASISSRFGLDVVAHIDREDAQVLPILARRFGARRRVDLGRRFVEVENIGPLRRSLHGARMPVGPTVVDRTTALTVWIRDSAMARGLAS